MQSDIIMSKDFIEGQLRRFFLQSPIYEFYHFLKSPTAQNFVAFHPPQNPNTFILSSTLLQDFSPKLNLYERRLYFQLQKDGLRLRVLKKRLWLVTHDELTYFSTEEEIMEEWKKAKLQCFRKSESYLTAVYNNLQSHNLWSPDGCSLILTPELKPYTLTSHSKDCQFTARRLDSQKKQIKHRFIVKSSPIEAWIVAYLRNLQRILIRKLKEEKRESFRSLKGKLEGRGRDCVRNYVRAMMLRVREMRGVEGEELEGVMRGCEEILRGIQLM